MAPRSGAGFPPARPGSPGARGPSPIRFIPPIAKPGPRRGDRTRCHSAAGGSVPGSNSTFAWVFTVDSGATTGAGEAPKPAEAPATSVTELAPY